MIRFALLFMVAPSCIQFTRGGIQDDAKTFVDDYNRRTPVEGMKNEEAFWAHATNLNKENLERRINASLVFAAFMKAARVNASKFDVNDLSGDVARQVRMIKGTADLKNDADFKKLKEIEGQMEEYYSSAKVFDSVTGKNLSLEPDLTNILSKSRDYNRLLFAWKGWRSANTRIRPLFEQFVTLSNKGARENDWSDTGTYWRASYDVENLPEIVEGLWDSLKPLYQELHAYVRYKLGQKYGKDKVEPKKPVSAHLFGNMWSQSWANIYDLVEPFQNQSSLDVTANLVAQNYTAVKMVKLAESFFKSIGLGELPSSFWNRSMLTKPLGREVVCHASAWDFYVDTKEGDHDVRIKQCIDVTHNQLVTIHHELGHIYYFLKYWDQPFEYRDGANPGFHEAVGDTLSLSVDTPTHLKKIKLLNDYQQNSKSDINALMKMALRMVAFLPFGYLIDQWRWKVFKGEITPSNYNAKWWELRTKYQGIKPPVKRSENDFDPGAKYHIPANTPYIRYFISTVLQFQFHKAACDAAGAQEKLPLHKCSIYESKAAGTKLSDMLSMGKSKPWPEALEKVTGSKNMSVEPLKEYFQPLNTWLKQQRSKFQYPIGWEEAENGASSLNTADKILLALAVIFAFVPKVML